MIKRGDIVKLKYNGNYKTKLLKNIVNSDHPILILSILPNNKIRIATMSSNINSDAVKNLSRNVILTDLKGTGLSKSTYVDTSSTGIIDESNIYKVIGKVSQSDLNNILNEYSKTKQRQVIEAYKIYNSSNIEEANKVCGLCKHFLGMGDYNLCCDKQYDLTYTFSKPCSMFDGGL